MKSWIAALALLWIFRAHASSVQYPTNFLWGVATSAHQTEGKEGGGENSDWYRFEHSLIQGKSPILEGDNADVAVDFWNRYPEDLQIVQSLGINSMRISLAWEKVEPAQGQFNPDVIAHYRKILLAMKSLHIRPMVALHHFTHPLWFQARGGWLAKDSPDVFAEYASYVVHQLGDLCDLWITFNEPMVLVNSGFIEGKTPPLLHSVTAAPQATLNLAHAHRLATQAIHLVQAPVSRNVPGLHGVGIVNSLPLYAPENPDNPLDQLAAAATDELANWSFLKLAVSQTAGDSSNVDWLGVNYYTRYAVEVDSDFAIHVMSSSPSGVIANNGLAVYPQGLEAVLRKAASEIDVPWIVSENGVSDSADTIRPDDIRETLQSLDQVMTGEHPLDVRGYFHWSLMDNFEWLLGYTQKFGLVEIDFQNGLARVPRPSAWVYRNEIESRSGGKSQ